MLIFIYIWENKRTQSSVHWLDWLCALTKLELIVSVFSQQSSYCYVCVVVVVVDHVSFCCLQVCVQTGRPGIQWNQWKMPLKPCSWLTTGWASRRLDSLWSTLLLQCNLYPLFPEINNPSKNALSCFYLKYIIVIATRTLSRFFKKLQFLTILTEK